MSTKKILIILFLSSLTVLLATKYMFFQNNETTITIRNHTNENIENLIFSSNDNEKEFSISNIQSYTDISFEYYVGGFNENAVNLKHISESGKSKNYNIIGYVSEFYSYIYIDITSISLDGELNIQVETH
ncbi:hypothetical protein Amet_4676 [Alkaliphilus metalliredigens QYMF]|uniref:Uncharacterized protein n=1 Tax=Alkaliphilus metalliredigens (strain QYMF) TaxID=293826 RepID=A6TX26_ALKMQ|nr:hypothetical protein [Alkaliphilus metalliredigens]ABR50744.1 hypothetical protein Amet_4676 [Alkaliphilus metalliredigens QYMF]